MLWMPFHCIYRFGVEPTNVGEIAALYSLKVVGTDALTIQAKDLGTEAKTCLLSEVHGERRLT